MGRHARQKDETGTFLFLPWVLQNGGDLKALDSPEATAALAFWTKLVNEGYAPKSAITDGFAEIYQQFTTGKAAMMIRAPGIIHSEGCPNLTDGATLLHETAASSLGGENWPCSTANSKMGPGIS
jgi:maltose-binding protein MalE